MKLRNLKIVRREMNQSSVRSEEEESQQEETVTSKKNVRNQVEEVEEEMTVAEDIEGRSEDARIGQLIDLVK